MNKSIIFTIHLALLFLLNGCQFENTEPADPLFTGSKTEDPSVSNSKVLIDPELYSDLKTFDYRIDSAWIVTDSLKLIVSYTGCEPGVPNRLLFDGSFMESYPVQARLKFVLDDPGDCDMAIVEEFFFDLGPLRESYRKSYQAQSATIIIHLEGYKEELNFNF